MNHAESCKKCKAALLKALQIEHGEVIQQWKPEWPCQIDDLYVLDVLTPSAKKSLKQIFKALRTYRGHRDFVKRRKIPACDYYIPSLNRLLEFDESQHFSAPRSLTFTYYPTRIRLGFNKSEWLDRCQTLNRHDNDPPYRDETRAWYDTLRDILPIQFGMKPTIRIYSKQMIWCKENGQLKKFVKSLS